MQHVQLILMLSTRQARADNRSKNGSNLVKNVKIVKFHDRIWNHHEKYIEISTNMPVVVGSLIRERDVKIISEM